MNERDSILEQQIGDIGGEPNMEQESLGQESLGQESLGQESLGQESLGQESLGKAKYLHRKKETRDTEDLPIKTGWIEVGREEFGERSQFYPETWKFYIKPATVEDIKNWSSIDESRLDQVNSTLNEILKSCVKIVTNMGNVSWGKIKSWDRFWFLLKIREYTFSRGENKIAYDDECENCSQSINFELNSNNLVFELPDQDIINEYWDANSGVWSIDPKEYDVNGPIIKFYAPTLEKDEAIFNWALKKTQEGHKPTDTLLRFLPWMVAKTARDEKVMEKFIDDAISQYKMWGVDMFSLAEQILRNVIVIPNEKLRAICPHCGEEVESEVRFPNGIRSLFDVQSGHKKFGKK